MACLHPRELILLRSEKPAPSVRFCIRDAGHHRAKKKLAVLPNPTVTVFGLLVGQPRPFPIVPSVWKMWVPLAWFVLWGAWWRCSQTARASCSCSDPQRAPLVSVWPMAVAVETQVCC